MHKWLIHAALSTDHWVEAAQSVTQLMRAGEDDDAMLSVLSVDIKDVAGWSKMADALLVCKVKTEDISKLRERLAATGALPAADQEQLRDLAVKQELNALTETWNGLIRKKNFWEK